ncbi:MAG: peptidoglycan editing factor PgeF [Betaproteobacteria bacterium]
MRAVEQGGVAWLEAASLSATGLVVHGFSTRLGGRRQLLEALGLGRRPLVVARQVHGDDLLVVRSAQEVPAVAEKEGDGLLTASPEVALAVLTADCLPVLLFDPRRRVVAAVHSGWRGTVRRISGKAVRRMVEEFGSAAQDLLVAIGPGIGPCCYEVDEPVLEQVAAAFPEVAEKLVTPSREGRAYLDLRAAVRHDLKESGVPAENVTTVEECTACCPDWFFSYRREGSGTGRMAAVIGLREG